MIPYLSWTRDRTGRRAWRFPSPQFNVEDQPALHPELAAVGGGGNGVLDALVGLVTVPYLFPRLSSGWPQWRPLVSGGKSNYIGPASAPMISLLHRRALLNSPLVARTESFWQAISRE